MSRKRNLPASPWKIHMEVGGYMRQAVNLLMLPVWSIIGGIIFVIFGCIAVIDYFAHPEKV
jgi:hypothetical protein